MFAAGVGLRSTGYNSPNQNRDKNHYSCNVCPGSTLLEFLLIYHRTPRANETTMSYAILVAS